MCLVPVAVIPLQRPHSLHERQRGEAFVYCIIFYCAAGTHVDDRAKCWRFALSAAGNRLRLSQTTSTVMVLQGQGLSEKQIAMCDSFVYIAQYGDGTASLNVTVATSIVLQHFAQWAGYREHRRDGQKFVVGERPQRTAPRGIVSCYSHFEVLTPSTLCVP